MIDRLPGSPIWLPDRLTIERLKAKCSAENTKVPAGLSLPAASATVAALSTSCLLRPLEGTVIEMYRGAR